MGTEGEDPGFFSTGLEPRRRALNKKQQFHGLRFQGWGRGPAAQRRAWRTGLGEGMKLPKHVEEEAGLQRLEEAMKG